MDANFRFTFDDFFIVNDQPKGWDESKIVIKRNDDFAGLFLEYVTELEFWGDGYSYIKQQVDDLGFCFNTKVSIEYQCSSNGPYENVFTGYANISRSEINELECTIKINLEVDNIYADFLNSADRQIPLSPSPISFPNGNIVDPNYQTISYHNVETGKNALEDPTDNRALAINTIDALNYLAGIITEGDLSVVSDFFTIAQPQIDIWTVTVAGAAMKSGDTISITYRNIWGYTITKTQAYVASEINTLTQLMLQCMDQSDLTTLRGVATVCNFFMHFAFSYGHVGVFLPRVLLLYSWLPIEIISVEIIGSAPVATVSFAEFQSYQKGGQGLYVTNQLNETFNSKIWNFQANTVSKLSFRQLYDELDKLFYLGMTLQGTPGNYQLRIEPMEYFYALDSQIRITGVDDIRSTFDVSTSYKQINMTSGSGTMGAIKFPTAFVSDGAMAFGTNTITWTLKFYNVSQGDYLYSVQSGEVFRVATVGGSSLTTTEPTIYGITSSNFFIGSYEEVKSAIAWINGDYGANIGSCIGDTLDLNNQFVIEIEKHGDQTQSNYAQTTNPYSSISAGADKESFSFIQCHISTKKSIQERYIVNGYVRDAFNSTLTNHHKIFNNALRIKYDATAYMPSFAEHGGEPLIYKNTSDVKPMRVHEFDYFLSFTDINTIIQNPAQTIEVEMKGSIVKCWIKEIEFDINTKKTHFKLYESL